MLHVIYPCIKPQAPACFIPGIFNMLWATWIVSPISAWISQNWGRIQQIKQLPKKKTKVFEYIFVWEIVSVCMTRADRKLRAISAGCSSDLHSFDLHWQSWMRLEQTLNIYLHWQGKGHPSTSTPWTLKTHENPALKQHSYCQYTDS